MADKNRFSEEVSRVAKEKGIPYKEAFDAVRLTNQRLFRAYVDATGSGVRKDGQFVKELAERIAVDQGVTFREALDVVREEYPENWRCYAGRGEV